MELLIIGALGGLLFGGLASKNKPEPKTVEVVNNYFLNSSDPISPSNATDNSNATLNLQDI